MSKIKVLSVIGTRPEAIKMAPVIRELASRTDAVTSRVCTTAQHREMSDRVLSSFGIAPDFDLDIMRANQSPLQVAARVMSGLAEILRKEKPDWVLVQGDTTTVFAAAVAAFYMGVKVGHVEAGLRTFDKWHPFPEEINRRIAGVVADLHFAPTTSARENLLREGVDPSSVLVTGNTVIDALKWITSQSLTSDDARAFREVGLHRHLNGSTDGKKLIVVTAHRRENHGKPLENICAALVDLASRYPEEVEIVYPVHPHPAVQEPARELLSGVANVTLTPPLDYRHLVHLIQRSFMVLTDSGGLQEEAPGLGKPVLVLRECTERPEGVEAGTVRLVGAERRTIVREAARLIEDNEAYRKMATAINPYGDGQSSRRIVDSIVAGINSVLPFGSRG